MSKLRVCVLSRFLVSLIFATILFSIPNVSARLAFADSAQTTGNAEGASAGSGNGGGLASVDLSATSTAASAGNHNANGASNSNAIVLANQGAGANTVTISVSAKASAKSTKKKIEAYASASADNAANSNDGTSTADTRSSNSGQAYAQYDKKTGAIAYASSSNGGYALAVAGPVSSVAAFVPGGTTTITTRGRRTVAIAYTDLGAYSIAITNGRKSRALTGTTENVSALAAGNIKAAIQSSMYAEANASRREVSAFASATARGLASNLAGSASGYGHAYAFAKVTRSGGKMVVAVASSSSRDGCGPRWWERQIKNRKCVIIKKVVSLKKFKAVAGNGFKAKSVTHKNRKKRK